MSEAALLPADRLFLTSAQDATNVEAMFEDLAGRLVSGRRDV